jgi:PHD/YefM family antitoxin component YafN of YafNO toxin-antitoxin module
MAPDGGNWISRRTGAGGETVVLVSPADWVTMDETSHLLLEPANAARLTKADPGVGRGRRLAIFAMPDGP